MSLASIGLPSLTLHKFSQVLGFIWNLMECTDPSQNTACIVVWMEPNSRPQLGPEESIGTGGPEGAVAVLLTATGSNRAKHIVSLSHPSTQPWSLLQLW